MFKNTLLSLEILIIFVILMSCSTATVMKESAAAMREPSGNLEETLKAYYKCKIEKNYEASWRFERISVNGDVDARESDRKQYIENGEQGATKEANILSIGIEGAAEEGLTAVKLRIRSEWPRLPNFKFPAGDRVYELNDLWDKINGKWYHVIVGMSKNW
ncbi:MAG: hypothetical protein HQK89_08205 [Nitrospirae bacterium]|nr:hypothetical protein [Nitrospirota bacterium]